MISYSESITNDLDLVNDSCCQGTLMQVSVILVLRDTLGIFARHFHKHLQVLKGAFDCNSPISMEGSDG